MSVCVWLEGCEGALPTPLHPPTHPRQPPHQPAHTPHPTPPPPTHPHTGMPALRDLDVSGCEQLTPAGLRWLECAPQVGGWVGGWVRGECVGGRWAGGWGWGRTGAARCPQAHHACAHGMRAPPPPPPPAVLPLLQLRRLSMQTCHQAGGLAALRCATALQRLDVGWCGGVTGERGVVVGADCGGGGEKKGRGAARKRA